MNTVDKAEYASKIKQREIIGYIIEHGENFNFLELANHMGMTSGQLRREIKCLLDQQDLIVTNEVLKVAERHEIMYDIYIKRLLEDKADFSVTEKELYYIPSNFQSKFKGCD